MQPITLRLSNEELVRQYQAGKSTIQLAKLCYCHPGTIRNHLRRLGIPLRRSSRKQINLTREELAYLVQVVGMSDAQLGTRFNVSGSTIRNRRLDLGITSHPRNAVRSPHSRNGRPTRAQPQQQEATNG